jgi:hypothetical protein
MSAKERFIEVETKRLEARQAALLALGTPDEFIPVQIAQLGNTYDAMMYGRAGVAPAATGD